MGLILNTLLSLPHFIYVCKSQKNKVFITAFNLSCLSDCGDYMTHHILIYGDGTIRRQMAQKPRMCHFTLVLQTAGFFGVIMQMSSWPHS